MDHVNVGWANELNRSLDGTRYRQAATDGPAVGIRFVTMFVEKVMMEGAPLDGEG